MTDSTPREDFLESYLRDKSEGRVRPPESYLEEFPLEVEQLVRAVIEKGGARPATDLLTDEGSLEQLGPYKIIKELGRGGQGIVFLAEDTRLGRRVALKVLTSWGQASAEVLVRFQREAAIASKLDHAGICTVYETGEAHGAPYLAMRYVEGESLASMIASASTADQSDATSFADLEDMSDEDSGAPAPEDEEISAVTTNSQATQAAVRRIVELIEKTARALHAAHEAGVIHRDMKPGNIMITSDGDPVILDFGLARDTETDGYTLTQTGALFGTPAYMAPEQLMAKRIRVDRRADIWSLGVALYECLGLRRPFKAPTREGLYQTILTREPPDLQKLNTAVPKDLKVIVGMAIEKDRDRRYVTALDFAEDLRRFLENKPIAARPVGPMARVFRWAQRNPVVAGLAALLFVSMSAGLIWISMQNMQLVESQKHLAQSNSRLQEKTLDVQEAHGKLTLSYEELEQANEQLTAKTQEAVEARDRADRIAEFQSGMLEDIDTFVMGQWLVSDLEERIAAQLKATGRSQAEIEAKMALFRDLIQRAQPSDVANKFVDENILSRAEKQIETEFGQDPQAEAALRHALSTIYEKLSFLRRATQQAERAVELRRKVLGDEHPETLESIQSLGWYLWKSGGLHNNNEDVAEGASLMREALAGFRKVLGDEAERTLYSQYSITMVLWSKGEHENALANIREVFEKQRRVLGPENEATIVCRQGLAAMLRKLGKDDESEKYYTESLEVCRRAFGELNRHTINAIHGLGSVAAERGRPAEALKHFRRMVELSREFLGDHHPDTGSKINRLAIQLKRMGQYEEAEPLYLDLVDLRRKVLGNEHPNTLVSINNLAFLYIAQKKHAGAEHCFRELLEGEKNLFGEVHSRTVHTRWRLANQLGEQEKFDEAVPMVRKALDGFCEVFGEEHRFTLSVRHSLGTFLFKQGQLEEAEALARENLKQTSSGLPQYAERKKLLDDILARRRAPGKDK